MAQKKIVITVAEPAIKLPGRLQEPPQAKLDMDGFNEIEAMQVLSSVLAGIAAQLAAKTNEVQAYMQKHNKQPS